jgi:hypothetical protein
MLRHRIQSLALIHIRRASGKRIRGRGDDFRVLELLLEGDELVVGLHAFVAV